LRMEPLPRQLCCACCSKAHGLAAVCMPVLTITLARTGKQLSST
jgi:hypothetical protein